MKKYIQNKNIVIVLVVLLIVSFLLFLNVFSKDKLFKKDVECVNLTRSFAGSIGSIHAFYSTKRNSCVYIYAVPNSDNASWAEVFDISNRAQTLARWDNKEKITLGQFIENTREQYR